MKLVAEQLRVTLQKATQYLADDIPRIIDSQSFKTLNHKMVAVKPEGGLAHGTFDLRQNAFILLVVHRRIIGKRLVLRQYHAQLGVFFTIGGRQLNNGSPQRRAMKQVDPPVADVLAEIMRPQLLGLFYGGPKKLRQDGIGHTPVSVQIGHNM